MDLLRFGRSIRALRRRKGWRQVDLAAAARVSRPIIVRIETGASGSIGARKLDAVAAALGARADLRVSWNGEALDRLLDADHASLVEVVSRILRENGWDVAAEVTFWIRGERGSVDVLAFHPIDRIVLIVEVKSVVPDQQATLAALDRKVRLAIEIARTRGWEPTTVAKLLVVEESRTSRRRIEAHSSTWAAELPDRGVAIRRWLREPSPASPLRGLWFLSDAHLTNARHRVRRR